MVDLNVIKITPRDEDVLRLGGISLRDRSGGSEVDQPNWREPSLSSVRHAGQGSRNACGLSPVALSRVLERVTRSL